VRNKFPILSSPGKKREKILLKRGGALSFFLEAKIPGRKQVTLSKKSKYSYLGTSFQDLKKAAKKWNFLK
jgi:hypothetical protein